MRCSSSGSGGGSVSGSGGGEGGGGDCGGDGSGSDSIMLCKNMYDKKAINKKNNLTLQKTKIFVA